MNVAANRTHHSNSSLSRGGGGDKPGDVPKVLELDFDCTDPYGRYEIDHDGKGGAPPAEDYSSDEGEGGAGSGGPDGVGAGVGGKGTEKDKAKGGGTGGGTTTPGGAVPRVPQRKATVFVSTAPLRKSQGVSVLSAAVSSTERISSDRLSALGIARDLDSSRGVGRGDRLDDVLEHLFPGGEDAMRDSEADVLDVAISYLRRVHLLSFYNGCTSADGLGSTLGGSHPSGTIHLRLKGADDILKKAAEEQAADDIYDDLPEVDGGETHKDKSDDDAAKKSQPAKDMLVMRLDESIERAVETCASLPGDYAVDEETDALAMEIEGLEDRAKGDWIDKHAIIDQDRRARCSFHFCRKLFKDKSFLQKHLHKKHPEFLRAEAAKCHDQYMMKAWDAEGDRPVPPVLVDCGSQFGLVQSAVLGAERPLAPDPEPELWRRESERRRRIEEEEELYRERRAAAEAAMEERRREEQRDRDRDDRGRDDGGGPRKRKADNSFVDVDDVKDEKVELKFGDVDVVAPLSKKKKKKKKKKLL